MKVFEKMNETALVVVLTGARDFACDANYPHQALKGGYFVFLWIVGTRLDLILDES